MVPPSTWQSGVRECVCEQNDQAPIEVHSPSLLLLPHSLSFPRRNFFSFASLSLRRAQSAHISLSSLFARPRNTPKMKERQTLGRASGQLFFFFCMNSNLYLQRSKPPAAQTLDNRPELPGTLLKDKLAAVPDGNLFSIQGFDLEPKLLGRVDQMVVHFDKDARAHLDHRVCLARVLDMEGTAPSTNLVRLLENRDGGFVLVVEVGWLQVVVEKVGRRGASCASTYVFFRRGG